jgi:hypothetical protein
MKVKIVVTKKSDPRNVQLFEKAIRHFHTTTTIKHKDRASEIELVRSLVIERRGF